MKVGLRLFLIISQSSDEDGTEIGCGGSLGHSNAIVTARNSDEMFGSHWQGCTKGAASWMSIQSNHDGDQIY